MDDVLRTVLPFVGGVVVAGIGYYAVHQQNRTQRETLRETTASQAEQQRHERLTAWRRERYGELSAAFGEFQGALRSMNLALHFMLVSFAGDDQARRDHTREQFLAASDRFERVYLNSRLLEASVQVADKDVAQLAGKIVDTLYQASRYSVAFGSRLRLPDDEQLLNQEEVRLQKLLVDTTDLIYDLNRRIENLISAGD